MFLGRKKELGLLQDLWLLDKSSLVICRGRRRIGKSRLIKEFAKSAKHSFLFQGLPPRKDQCDIDQLNHFYQKLREWNPALPNSATNLSWPQALTDLAKSIGTKKKVLILLDEISWIAQHCPDFAGHLKNAWDDHFSTKSNLIFVVCGSVSTWIELNILSSTGFVGRVSLTLNLDELSLSESFQLLPGSNDFEKIRSLCLTGGVPKYIEEFSGKQSLRENTQRLFFSKGGVLFEDFDRIFNDIFLKKSDTYRAIVETLVEGNKSISEIAKSLKVGRGGSLSKYLRDLVISGFLAENSVFLPGGRKNKTTYFRIKDNYIRFYLKYIFPKKTQIENGWSPKSGIETLPGWESILGLQFENCILNNLKDVFRALHIDPSRVKSASPHIQTKNAHNKGACQIDLLIEVEGYELILCEIKLRALISASVIKEIDRKAKILKRPRHYSLRTALIYFGQLANSDLFEEKINYVISAEDLIAIGGSSGEST